MVGGLTNLHRMWYTSVMPNHELGGPIMKMKSVDLAYVHRYSAESAVYHELDEYLMDYTRLLQIANDCYSHAKGISRSTPLAFSKRYYRVLRKEYEEAPSQLLTNVLFVIWGMSKRAELLGYKSAFDMFSSLADMGLPLADPTSNVSVQFSYQAPSSYKVSLYTFCRGKREYPVQPSIVLARSLREIGCSLSLNSVWLYRLPLEDGLVFKSLNMQPLIEGDLSLSDCKFVQTPYGFLMPKSPKGGLNLDRELQGVLFGEPEIPDE